MMDQKIFGKIVKKISKDEKCTKIVHNLFHFVFFFVQN